MHVIPKALVGLEDALRARRAVVGCLCAAVAVAGTFLGCATTIPPTDEPREGAEEHRWSCEVREGTAAEPWYGDFGTWEEDGGVMSSVHGTLWGHGGQYGRVSEEEAVRDALRYGAASALDLLERRGLPYGTDRRAEIEARTVEALLHGDEPLFPRVRLGGKVVEHCRDDVTGADSWRARVLLQYPVGHLRGDVVNATWERERLLHEARVLIGSAESHFSDGRWLNGQIDLERARAALLATGVPVGADLAEPGARRGQADGTLDERIRWQLGEWRRALIATDDLTVASGGGLEVVEVGAAAREEVKFVVSFEWGGTQVPAVGVPVRYEVLGGARAILDGDPVTDEDGIVTCRIVRAFGELGEHELRVEVDPEVVRAAGADRLWVSISTDGRRSETIDEGGPSASHPFFLVEGGHGLSICAEFTGDRERDASHARAGFVQRMGNDGYRTAECGPGVDVVVSARVALVTVVEPGSWAADVTIEGTAFDQRFARVVGGTSITVAEVSTEGQRDAELRALREAGRLLGIYLSRRILTSGE